MACELHILDAQGRLPALHDQLGELFRLAVAEVESYLPIDRVDCSVYYDPEATIPEVGIGAYTESPFRISLALDPENPAFHRNLAIEFVSAFAHECHHAVRMQGVGYGSAVGEALVSEGLACHFKSHFRGGAAPFYARALAATELARVARLAADRWGETPHDQGLWFFGKDANLLPLFAGYSIGYSIVGRGIDQLGQSAAQLVNESAESFRPLLAELA
ncbi:Predicted Zn-dependent protease [Paraburkholderia phenazinium]|uniref:Predicted Zn-dependent protease n=1 Tax=Paraburkholderia phenazinium TaxID=60549 RepID=A0A1N6HLC4_9BURK|nr:Predicted Zn-dependent protease [Paraburkholderia phenazinium]